MNIDDIPTNVFDAFEHWIETEASLHEGDEDNPIELAFRAGAEWAQAWRPIESAPRDGTRMILLVSGGPYIGQWDEDWNGDGEWIDDGFESAEFIVPPTHWQPLPPAPHANPL